VSRFIIVLSFNRPGLWLPQYDDVLFQLFVSLIVCALEGTSTICAGMFCPNRISKLYIQLYCQTHPTNQLCNCKKVGKLHLDISSGKLLPKANYGSAIYWMQESKKSICRTVPLINLLHFTINNKQNWRVWCQINYWNDTIDTMSYLFVNNYDIDGHTCTFCGHISCLCSCVLWPR
jgi:hypothetical protein